MRQPGDTHRFALESRERRGIPGQPGGQDLDRDVAVEPRIARAIDLAHSSGAERRNDLVVTEAGPRGKWHVPVFY